MNNELLADILEQLKTFCNVNEAIFADQEGDKPKYPYMTAKIISRAGTGSQGIYTRKPVQSDNPDFEYNIEIARSEELQTTVSFSIFAKDAEESESLARTCANWFKFFGYEYMKTKDIVVAEIGQIANRDTLIITDYERRWGFDVTFRSTEKLTIQVPTIEKLDINGEIFSL
jgi:hypothetical protein